MAASLGNNVRPREYLRLVDDARERPGVAVGRPARETPESRWIGWEQFCSSHAAAVQQLALGRPLSKEDWLLLRIIQQPPTDPRQPHRYLPESWQTLRCWVCELDEGAQVHRSWTAGEDENEPDVITISDFATIALEAACGREADSPRDLWLRCRYRAVMQALQLDRSIVDEAKGDTTGNSVLDGALVDLFGEICGAYLHSRSASVGEGILEAPAEWAPLADGYRRVRAAREELDSALRAMAADVVGTIFDERAHATTTTSVLWAAGIPLCEPDLSLDLDY